MVTIAKDRQLDGKGWLVHALSCSEKDEEKIIALYTDIFGVSPKKGIADGAAATHQGLSLELKADKKSFASKEDVIVTIVLKNENHHEWNLDQWHDNPNSIGHRSAFRFRVNKEGEKDDGLYIHMERLKKMKVDFERCRLSPGESITLKVTLNRWYEMMARDKYSIVCIYLIKGPFPMDENMPMWEGVLKSNPVDIVIQ